VALLAMPGWRHRTSAQIGAAGLLFVAAFSLLPLYVMRHEPFGAPSFEIVGGYHMALAAATAILLVVPVWRRWLLSQAWSLVLLYFAITDTLSSYNQLWHVLGWWGMGIPLLLTASLIWADVSSIYERPDEAAKDPITTQGMALAIRVAAPVALFMAFCLPTIRSNHDYFFMLALVGGPLAVAGYIVARRRLVRARERPSEAS
jgi:hypothetical protein